MQMVTNRAGVATLIQKSESVMRQRRTFYNDVIKDAGEQPDEETEGEVWEGPDQVAPCRAGGSVSWYTHLFTNPEAP